MCHFVCAGVLVLVAFAVVQDGAGVDSLLLKRRAQGQNTVQDNFARDMLSSMPYDILSSIGNYVPGDSIDELKISAIQQSLKYDKALDSVNNVFHSARLMNAEDHVAKKKAILEKLKQKLIIKHPYNDVFGVANFQLKLKPDTNVGKAKSEISQGKRRFDDGKARQRLGNDILEPYMKLHTLLHKYFFFLTVKGSDDMISYVAEKVIEHLESLEKFLLFLETVTIEQLQSVIIASALHSDIGLNE